MTLALTSSCLGFAQVAGTSGGNDLVIADAGKTEATIVVSPNAGEWEKRAASDLAIYIEKMSGAKPAVANTADAIAAALKSKSPLLIVGQEALNAEPDLKKELAKVAKKNPELQADAIVVRRAGNRVYLAGTNDDSHYFAVAELLQRWGCRWYFPSEFGECIPKQPTLKVGRLDHAYAPPFEIRNYWVAWNGEQEGREEFKHRNFMNRAGVNSGHAIGQYTKDLVPPGKTVMDVAIAEDATAEHVAKMIAPDYAKGVPSISLGMEDGTYRSDSPRDKELQAGLFDKYFIQPALTDGFMTFYNKVAEILVKQYPNSPTKLGFLAYSNITIPPQRNIVAAKSLITYLAPIDIDPNHGMDDRRSPPQQEYRDILYRWSEVMQGRVAIYDYDQGMLVWRDIPNPSFATIRDDFKHYRKAGILGVSTESRGAIGTVFLNLFMRGQLLWNPDADINALLTEFYEKFYGPAAKPMAAYWGAIFKAWDDTIVTEHEYFVAPAIYTPQLIKELKKHLEAAESLVKGGDAKLAERMKFTRNSFGILENYIAMVNAAATECDYKAAVAAGEKGVAARLELAKMNTTFTTRVINVAAETEANGPAWWLGEVKQYRDLGAFTDGTKGSLITKLPLEWSFRRDPHDTGIVQRWAADPVDLTEWNSLKNKGNIESHIYCGSRWEMLRTDLYAQAQGVLYPDWNYYNGIAWYRTDVDLGGGAAKGKVHVYFPGLFNECWLYVNGYLVAYRPFPAMWWLSDYKFEWDVDLTGKMQPGKNTIALRINNPHHMGGMFRRPFLYAPKE
jgi:hypothetical protein